MQRTTRERLSSFGCGGFGVLLPDLSFADLIFPDFILRDLDGAALD
jgi:hypothetical protein